MASGRGGRVLLRRILLVAFFIEVGLLLIVLPWSAFWERNYFATLWPDLKPFMVSPFIRGAISGLGVLNLLAGLFELAPIVTPRE